MSRFDLSVLFCLVLAIAACGSPEPPAPPVGETTAEASPPPVPGPAPSAVAESEPDCTLTMGWDPWEPYHYRDVTGTVSGLDVEIVSEIVERAGCSLAFRQDHWANLLDMLRSGEIDFLPGATRTQSRESYALFSAPYRDESFALYVRSGEADNYTGSSLEELLAGGFRVGVTNDYVYGDEVGRLESDPRYSDKFIGVSIGELNFEKLRNMEIDGFLEDPFVAAAMMRKRDLADEVERHAIVLDSGEVHLMFSRASVSPETVAAVDDGLAAVRADGSYQALLDKYGN